MGAMTLAMGLTCDRLASHLGGSSSPLVAWPFAQVQTEPFKLNVDDRRMKVPDYKWFCFHFSL